MLRGGGNNMFNVLGSEDEDTDTADDDATTATQAAAFTTVSTLGTTYGGATNIPAEISTAINQLAANQLAIQQQVAAMTFAANSPSPPHPISNSPNPEHGAATFCRSGTGHIQQHSRWWRSPAWWTWWWSHRKPWRWSRRRSVCTTISGRVWRHPPICQWPTNGVCTSNRSMRECPFPI
jgi:hypothetical protein